MEFCDLTLGCLFQTPLDTLKSLLSRKVLLELDPTDSVRGCFASASVFQRKRRKINIPLLISILTVIRDFG
jgi:hypothetical protein